MRKLLMALLLSASPAAAAELTFVESVPEETVYGSPLTERPQAVWLDMINGAQKTLDIEQFYIAHSSGEALGPVLEAVKAAGARGVRVRVLVEKVMMGESGKVLPELAAAPGVETRVIEFRKAAGGIQHAKFFVADGREVFFCSQNFDWRALSQIHELGVRIKSERAAADFGAVFEADWAFAADPSDKSVFKKGTARPLNRRAREEASVNGGKAEYSLAFSPAKLLPKGFDSELDVFLELIKGAKKTLRGQVMTYSLFPHGRKTRWKGLDEALRAAGRRGVKVELIIADWTMGGKNDADVKSLASAKNVSVKISSVPQNSRGFFPYSRVEHCKYAVADGRRGFVSTSNWSEDYFKETRGAAMLSEGESAGAVLEDVFARAWAAPYAEPVAQDKEYETVKRN